MIYLNLLSLMVMEVTMTRILRWEVMMKKVKVKVRKALFNLLIIVKFVSYPAMESLFLTLKQSFFLDIKEL